MFNQFILANNTPWLPFMDMFRIHCPLVLAWVASQGHERLLADMAVSTTNPLFFTVQYPKGKVGPQATQQLWKDVMTGIITLNQAMEHLAMKEGEGLCIVAPEQNVGHKFSCQGRPGEPADAAQAWQALQSGLPHKCAQISTE